MWDLLLSEVVSHTILNQLKWAFYNITCFFLFFPVEKKKKDIVTVLVSLASEKTFPGVSYLCVLN